MKLPYKLAVLLTKLKEAGCEPIRAQGGELRLRCPAHDDKGPSLYVAVAEGKILLNCKAGCTAHAICDRLDHDIADLFLDGDELLEADQQDVPIEEEVSAGPESSTTAESASTPTFTEDLRHTVYSSLLGALELSTDHFQALRKRGLAAAEISKRGYRTTDAAKARQLVDQFLSEHGPEKLVVVPGFAERDGRVFFQSAKGLLIPVRDLAGEVVALKVRHDDGHTGGKYSWVSSKNASCGNVVHVPLGVPVPSATVRLTEGELKADVATALSGLPTISAPGVTNWQLAVPVLKALGANKVLLAMDQDGKAGTLQAIEKALYGLTAEGFEVVLEVWDGAIAKGVDDLLAAGQQPEQVTGLAAAVRVRNALAPPVVSTTEAAEPEPPPLPLDVFPPALGTYLREVGESTGTPPDFAALTLLIISGAAIGNSRALCLKPNAWFESPRIYGVNVGDPASGKTPAMDAVVKPFQALQLRLIKQYKSAKETYDRAQAEYERKIRENRALPEEQRQSLPDVPPEPVNPERFVAMDVTIEALGPLLEENPRGLLMAQDEVVGWVRAMGQYKGGRGNDRQFWLAAWSGKTHFVDRKSQGAVPISIPRPFVNVIGGIPPDMLSELADQQGRNDGFFHRILFVFPRISTGTDWTEGTVSEESKKAWEDTLLGFRKLAMQELDDGVLGYKVVKLSPTAKEAWIAWYNAHAAETRGPDLALQLIGPWGKLKAYTARLALVLHYLWLVQGNGDEGDLEAVSIERAARLIDYLKAHLKVVYSRLRHTPEDNQLDEVVDWIRRAGGQCTARHLVNAKKITPTVKAKKFLIELQERGYGRLEWREGGNGRKVHWFVFDPS